MPHKTRSLVWIKRALAIKNDRDAEHGFVLIVGFPDDPLFRDQVNRIKIFINSTESQKFVLLNLILVETYYQY